MSAPFMKAAACCKCVEMLYPRTFNPDDGFRELGVLEEQGSAGWVYGWRKTLELACQERGTVFIMRHKTRGLEGSQQAGEVDMCFDDKCKLKLKAKYMHYDERVETELMFRLQLQMADDVKETLTQACLVSLKVIAKAEFFKRSIKCSWVISELEDAIQAINEAKASRERDDARSERAALAKVKRSVDKALAAADRIESKAQAARIQMVEVAEMKTALKKAQSVSTTWMDVWERRLKLSVWYETHAFKKDDIQFTENDAGLDDYDEVPIIEIGFSGDLRSPKLKEERGRYMEWLSRDGCMLQHVPDMYRSNKQVLLTAVSNDGLALEWVPESFKKDREIILAAVDNNGEALQFADGSLRQNKEFVHRAELEKSARARREFRARAFFKFVGIVCALGVGRLFL